MTSTGPAGSKAGRGDGLPYQAHRSADDLASLLELIHAAADARGWKWEELSSFASKARPEGRLKAAPAQADRRIETQMHKERESICFRALFVI